MPRPDANPGTSKKGEEHKDVDKDKHMAVDVKREADEDEEEIIVEWPLASPFRCVGSTFPSDWLTTKVLAYCEETGNEPNVDFFFTSCLKNHQLK